MAELEEQRRVRIGKLTQWRQMGVDPYPAQSHRTHACGEFKDNFDQISVATLAGRVRGLRSHGKSTFLDLEDDSGRAQAFISEAELGAENYSRLSWLDLGDFVEITGSPFLTKTQTKTLRVNKLTLLTKTLRPIPEEHFGLKDEEVCCRQRYLDLLVNPQVKNRFRQRSAMIASLRRFLESHGSIEVETAVFEHIPGGADAEPFVTHHQTLDMDLYLRISLELQLKRLMVGGFEKIHEIGRVFRNEGMSTQHLQEFTMLEFYWAYHDLDQLINIIQTMYQTVLQETFGTLSLVYRGQVIDYSGVWTRLDYQTLFQDKTGLNLDDYPDKESLLKATRSLGLPDLDEQNGRGRIIDQVYKKLIRPTLIQPTVLVNHPLDLSPLAKKRPGKPNTVHRMQVLVAGVEVGNGFAELNDPLDQRERLEKQQQLRDQGDKEAQRLDENFLEALEYGMPPTAGFGVGLDRVFMLWSGSDSIRDVVFFPVMRPLTG